jgi:hypothetical protein
MAEHLGAMIGMPTSRVATELAAITADPLLPTNKERD